MRMHWQHPGLSGAAAAAAAVRAAAAAAAATPAATVRFARAAVALPARARCRALPGYSRSCQDELDHLIYMSCKLAHLIKRVFDVALCPDTAV